MTLKPLGWIVILLSGVASEKKCKKVRFYFLRSPFVVDVLKSFFFPKASVSSDLLHVSILNLLLLCSIRFYVICYQRQTILLLTLDKIMVAYFNGKFYFTVNRCAAV